MLIYPGHCGVLFQQCRHRLRSTTDLQQLPRRLNSLEYADEISGCFEDRKPKHNCQYILFLYTVLQVISLCARAGPPGPTAATEKTLGQYGPCLVRAAAVLPKRLPALLRIVNIILEHFGHVSNICCALKKFAGF
jgi:hypothetical protein